jgi:hypothetical protein
VTLLREIQSAATDQSTDIATVLRKAKILAARLQNPEFERWVDHELKGYPESEDLPSYRIAKVSAICNLRDVRGGRSWDDAPVFLSVLPDFLKEIATVARLYNPISTYSAMIATDHEIRARWPQEYAVLHAGKGYNGFECVGAWSAVPRTSIIALVDAVRTRVLEFALKIEAAAPEAGETPFGSPAPIPQEKIAQIFNTYVTGNGNNVASGSPHSSLAATLGVTAGDAASLLAAVRLAGVDDKQLAELNEATKSGDRKKAAVEGWLSKFTMAATSGAASGTLSIVAKAVAAYLGFHVA